MASNLVLTAVGAAAIEAAYNAGEVVEITVAQIGDGGGAPVIADPATESLVNSFGSVPFSGGHNNDYMISGEVVIPAGDFPGNIIREVGLISRDGILIAYGAYPETWLPADETSVLKSVTIDFMMPIVHAESVVLVVDPDTAILTPTVADTLYLRQDKHLSEIAGQGEAAQAEARKNLALGALATKDSLTAADVGAVPQYDTVLNVDLNTLDGTKPGRYLQPMDADALTEYHYPVNNAGSLDVIRNGANGQAGCTQEYRPFNTNVLYRRHSNIADSVVSWSDWNPEYSQENQPPYPVTSVNGMTGAVTIPAPDLSGYETIADANARFLQGCRLGAEIAINQDGFVTDGGMRWVRAPAGCVLTGMLDASLSPDTINNIDTVYARPEQQNMNGVWVTVSE